MRSKDLHGFNYDGSWGSSGLDVWQHHDHGQMAVEIARGKSFFPGWNVARWWLSHEAYQRQPDRFLANFDAGLDIFAAHGIVVIPVLFNRWRDPVCDFGGVPLDHVIPYASSWTRADDLFQNPEATDNTAPVQRIFREYLAGVVAAHASDERIYSWDLCNEPLMGRYVSDEASPIRAAELTWLTWCYRTCKIAGARQPLTIGNYPNVVAVQLTEPISDIVSFHPYWMWSGQQTAEPDIETKPGFEKFLDECVDVAKGAGKELFGNETVWGARDHAQHVEVMRYTLDQLVQREIGFTVHALHHSLIADLHRDAYGPVGPAQWMHFIEPDGSLRPGHEAFNDFAPLS